MDEAEAEGLKIEEVDAVEITESVQKMWRPERMADHLQQAREERFGTQLRDVLDSS
ncbi:hypothetical protein [Natronococcus pandeyae]|uniref:hypothetical protein n=1 Tax=Natronococcus pandeyae TaxID=2055836 RepID=UPI001652EE4F|nr:hypothetical protein [Natronococcus pandeyae]